ncbi:hypothetical protein LQG66_24820 [Bradyrhizobium ontarionense]|uniref:DUF3456 domain-containing protein n=1 Tax=Bradyrhizobium ontarionense TaxID=2898149 RepID=A0ABY3R5B6_9BRAD|nr:hypothetical protein [Bradyrhizobium sp. A19]UFZ02495.1 hypothetical protein LQG66_24820 [Bradyrhizobium sp. A19]
MKSAVLATTILVAGMLLISAGSGRADSRLTGMAIVKGTCQKLVIAGKDRSLECTGSLLNTDYDDQRTGVYFTLLDGGVITFSNRGDLEERAGSDKHVAPVDLVIIGQYPNKKINRVAAKGRCRYGNPFKGPSLIECSADSELGRFEATFLSNGEKPEVKTF